MTHQIDDHSGSGWNPFHVVVLAELEPRREFALRCPVGRYQAPLKRGALDPLLRSIEPAFRLPLRDGATGQQLDVDIRWRHWEDVTGAGLLASPPLLSLRDARTSLLRGNQQTDPLPYVSRALSQGHAPLASGSAVAAPKSNSQSTTSDARGVDPLATLFEMVDLPASPERFKGPEDHYRQIAGNVGGAISTLLRDAANHDEYRRLRRVWQSLQTLASRLGDNGLVQVTVHCLSPDDDDFERVMEGVDADLLVWEAPFAPCARDAARLNLLADWGAEQSTPVLATLAPEWVGLSNIRDAESAAHPSEQARPWLDAIGRRAQSRWLILATNDVCESELVSSKAMRQGSSAEIAGGPDEAGWVFVPAAVAVGALTLDALVRSGEPFIPSDSAASFRSGGLSEIESPFGAMAIGTRDFCSIDTASLLAKRGILALSPTKNRDTVRIGAIPTAHRPSNAGGDLGEPASSLADQMLAGRVVKHMQRALPVLRDAPNRAVELGHLEATLQSLFPNAPPVGPTAEAVERAGMLSVSVQPRRYGGLTIEHIELSARLD